MRNKDSLLMEDNMKFYKYTPWRGESGNRTRQNMLDCAVYLNSPYRFNDPFDFNPIYETQASYKEKLKHIQNIYITHEKLTKEKARRKAIEVLKRFNLIKNNNSLEEYANYTKEGLRKNIGVTCFTINNTNSPMWAHYADQHTGICIEWNFPENIENFWLPEGVEKWAPLKLHKVSYSDERPIARIFDDSITLNDPLNESLLRKSTDWSYEKEYRLITPGHIGLAIYKPICLTGIIIGHKMSSASTEEVKKFIKKMKVEPRIYIAKPSKRGYNYDIESF